MVGSRSEGALPILPERVLVSFAFNHGAVDIHSQEGEGAGGNLPAPPRPWERFARREEEEERLPVSARF